MRITQLNHRTELGDIGQESDIFRSPTNMMIVEMSAYAPNVN